MKKLFTLLCLFLLGAGVASAGEIHKISFNGSNAFYLNGTQVSGPDIFSWNSEKHNFNTKFNGATYDGIEYSSGLKMEGATNVSFTSTAKANVTIVQSTWSANTIKFDGTEQSVSNATAGTGNCRIYTINDVAAGTHSLTRGSGESGVFCIVVEYTETAKEKLASPEIIYDAETGEVTIGTVANAEEYYYTIDGQAPSLSAADTYLYEEPFIVADGTTVKAIAVDTDDVYAISDITEELVLLNLTSIDAPAINVINGTFFVKSDVVQAKVEYRIGNGSWNTFTRAITLEEDATVYARASRDGVISDIVSENVTVVPQPAGTTSVLLIFDEGTTNNNVWTNEAGYVLTIDNPEKAWSKGNDITIGDTGYQSFKLSNGAKNTLDLPDGVTVKRMTFYSYVNKNKDNSVNGWREVNGDEYDINYAPMGAFNTDNDNPDVRIFDVDASGSITFTNSGTQLCFLLVLDVTGATTRPPMEPTLYDFTQELSDADVRILNADSNWTLSEDGKFWTYNSTTLNGSLGLSLTDGLNFSHSTTEDSKDYVVIDIAKDLKLPSNNTSITIPETAEGDVINIRFASNSTEEERGFTVKNGDESSLMTVEKQDFKVTVVRDAATTFTNNASVKIYQIAINMDLPEEPGDVATAISELKAEQTNGATYNLAGQRVSEGYKGVVVKNGKKVMVK